MSDLTQLTVCELTDGLKAKKFSAVELTQALLNKIEKHKNLNAFTLVAKDSALSAAQKADSEIQAGKLNKLSGIPGAIKDLILTKGVCTTAGSKILENFIPPYSATVVEKLLASGSHIIGKTNLDEFAMGSSNENSAWGAVRNPWNTDCVPGGSSGGSAAAVAGCLAPYALATDTGGSIRQPASLCSIVGMKPTYGRVSRYGVVAYASSLDQVGAMARTVKDVALITSIICGADPNDSTSVDQKVPDFAASLGSSIKGLRIGIPKEYFVKGMDQNVENLVRAAIKQLASLGAEIVEISLPHTEYALAVYYVIATAEASSNLARYDGVRYGHRTKSAKGLDELYCKSRSEGFGAEIKRRIMMGSYVLSSGYYDAYYLRAQKVRTLLANDFSAAFSKHCDLIACPVSPTPAFKLGSKTSNPLEMYLSDIFTLPLNLAGLPGLAVPCGFDPTGLPVGFQLIGKQWDEETLFKVGYAYEQATTWHKKLSPVATN